MASTVCILALASGCATRTAAPIVDRTGVSDAVVPPPPPVLRATVQPGAAQTLTHTVQRGETLYSIALAYGYGQYDLVSWNNLENPGLIHVGQVLRVAPPEAFARLEQPLQAPADAVPPPPPAAQAVPVITGTVEQRPLGAGTVIPIPLKTGPMGEKRPWSESAVAELSQPEAQTVVPSPPQVVPPPPPMQPAPAVVTRPPADDSAGIGWIWPAAGRVIEGFSDSGNKGIDIAGRAGDPVVAAGDGRVVYAGSGLRGYGNLVIINHDNDYLSAYAHNRTILVKEQQIIKKGQTIAEMGNSDADQVKLHFEIRYQGKPVDPMRYLPGR